MGQNPFDDVNTQIMNSVLADLDDALPSEIEGSTPGVAQSSLSKDTWLFKEDGMIKGPVGAPVIVGYLENGRFDGRLPVSNKHGVWLTAADVPEFERVVHKRRARLEAEAAEKDQRRQMLLHSSIQVFGTFLVVVFTAGVGYASVDWLLQKRPWDQTEAWLTKGPEMIDLRFEQPTQEAIVQNQPGQLKDLLPPLPGDLSGGSVVAASDIGGPAGSDKKKIIISNNSGQPTGVEMARANANGVVFSSGGGSAGVPVAQPQTGYPQNAQYGQQPGYVVPPQGGYPGTHQQLTQPQQAVAPPVQQVQEPDPEPVKPARVATSKKTRRRTTRQTAAPAPTPKAEPSPEPKPASKAAPVKKAATGLTGSQIKKGFMKASGFIKKCIKGELKTNPDMPSTVTISFCVSNDGRAVETELIERQVRNRPLAACVKAALKAKARWPEYGGEVKCADIPIAVSK